MADLLHSFAIAAHRINNCATTFAYNPFVCEYDCGHLLVATCLVFTNFFVVDSSNKLLAFGGALWLLGGILFTLFEIMVAGLQAFIFTVLASVYISESYPEEEEKSAVAVA